MPITVSDSSTFTCPFCTSKLKLQVPSSATIGDGKNIGNQGNTLFPPPGGQCLVVPSAPAPCMPSVNNVDPGQSSLLTGGLPALGTGCSYMCAKGGFITLDTSGQSSNIHDEAQPWQPLDRGAVEPVDLDLLWFIPVGGMAARGVIWGGKLAGRGIAAGGKYIARGAVAGGKLVARGAVAGAKFTGEVAGKAASGAKGAFNWVKNQFVKKPPPKPAGNPKNIDPKLPKDPFKDPNFKDVSHPEAAKRGHHTFQNQKTGETVRYDKAKPDSPGHKGQDHYHRENPNSTSKMDRYLDKDGNPVPDGSDASHLYPP